MSVEIELLSDGESKADEILRNLKLLYGTVAGELALDRDFGIDAAIIDSTQYSARAMLIAEYVRKTEKYEPRARVAKVEWTTDRAKDGIMTPKVVIEIV